MPVIKTKDFDQKFNHDIDWITLNRRLPLWQKGSYKVKEFGDFVTDIDLTARVYFNAQLINIISGVLRKNQDVRSPFTFIHMSVGKYDGYDVPWSIDDKGGCDFDPVKAKTWFDNFKISGLVFPSTLEYIDNKLFASKMTIQNLIDIENILHPYAEIVWYENDIRRGFVMNKNKRYNLLDEMKTETPVLEYVYTYGDEYVAIDVGLVDRNFVVPPSGKMYSYYTEDWYKIMKSFRWKLPEEDKPTYFDVMNTITLLIVLKYQIGLIEKLEKSKVLPVKNLINNTYTQLYNLGINFHGKTLRQIDEYLYEQVNKKLKDSVMHYATKLKSTEILLHLARGVDAQIPTTQEEIKLRRSVGVKCPFFPTDMDEFEQLTILAIRLDMDSTHVINCFSQVAIKLGKPVAQVIKDVVQNNDFSIISMDDEIILREHNIEKGRFHIKHKTTLQSYIILKRP